MGFGKEHTGVIIREQNTQALGALAADTAIKCPSLAITEDFRILKTELFAHVTGLTAGEGEGLQIGICNNELTAAEITECITANGPLDPDDRGLEEFATRNCKLLAMSEQTSLVDSQVNFKADGGGYMIVSKHRWTYSNANGWAFFIYNGKLQAVTTGSAVQFNATHYGVWVK